MRKIIKESHIELDNEDCILEVGDSIEIVSEGVSGSRIKEIVNATDDLVNYIVVYPDGSTTEATLSMSDFRVRQISEELIDDYGIPEELLEELLSDVRKGADYDRMYND